MLPPWIETNKGKNIEKARRLKKQCEYYNQKLRFENKSCKSKILRISKKVIERIWHKVEKH